MSRFKRIIILLVAFTGLLVIVGVLTRGLVAGAIVARAIDEVRARAEARGIDLVDVEPGHATLRGPFTLECEGLRGRVVMDQGLVSRGAEQYAVVVRRLRVEGANLFMGRLYLTVEGASVYKQGTDGEATGEWLSDLAGAAEVELSWLRVRGSIRRLEEQVARLISTGAMDLPARLRGRARFLVRREWFEATVYAERDGSRTRIRLEREDVKRVSERYAQPLTETEIDLVAHFPTRAPALLQITDKAKRAAAAQRRADRSFPEDAFRHVYWSYLLTRRFGADFAQVVTDAHEIDATYEKGAANRRMDLQNNALGRDYARAGVPEDDIARRVLTDVRVMRRAR